MRVHNPLSVKHFHEGLAGNAREFSLKSRIGEVRLLYEESAFHPQMRGHVVVGFIDDDPHRVGRKLCGIPVKDGWAWSRQAWGRLPEIWVSSQLITDERARQVAAQWPEKVAVHRLQVHMEPVSDDDVTSSAMVLSRSREGKESLTGQPS